MVGKLEVLGNDALVDGDVVTVQGIPFATTAAMDLYVRDADGSDSNPGTSALPLATLQAAIDKVPKNVRHVVRIHVGPHTGSGYALPEISYKDLSANLYLIGDGGGGGTDGFTEIVASSAAQSGSDATVVVTTGGLSTTEYAGNGEHFGRTIEILSGSAAGDRRSVLRNTATDIVPAIDFSAAVASGDLYRVVEPETVILGTGSSDKFITGVEGSGTASNTDGFRVILVNFKMTLASGNYQYLMNTYANLLLLGILSEKDLLIDAYRSFTFSGMEPSATGGTFSVYSPVPDLGVASVTSWRGWGLTYRNTNPSYGGASITGSGHFFYGGIIGSYLRVDSWAAAFVHYLNAYNDYSGQAIDVRYNSELWLLAAADRRFLIGTLTSVTTAIKLESRSRCIVWATGLNSLVMKGSGNLVVVGENSYLELNATGTDYMTLESSGGIGLLTKTLGQIKVGYVPPTCTCSGGDFSCSNGETVHGISELVSPSQFSEVANGVISRD